MGVAWFLKLLLNRNKSGEVFDTEKMQIIDIFPTVYYLCYSDKQFENYHARKGTDPPGGFSAVVQNCLHFNRLWNRRKMFLVSTPPALGVSHFGTSLDEQPMLIEQNFFATHMWVL